jgi:hypothetical protein
VNIVRSMYLSVPLLVLFTVLAAPLALAQDTEQKTFARASEAARALVEANRANDVAALNAILGPAAANLISSGDATSDKTDRAKFVSLYETHHRFTRTAPDRLTLLVGTNEWPLPIPLVKSEGGWRFDSEAGARELLYRRIGANELAAIKVAHALRRAQREYAASGHDGNSEGVYAQRFRSKPDSQDGLYWPVAEGQPPSPAGPLVADAEAQGYESGVRHPFYGYYFRILKAQGPHAAGGAKDYIVDGKMTGGFAILMYPAEYGSSGIMSFMVGPEGIVYESDLGDQTTASARAMNSFDPDPSSWKPQK